MKGAKELSEGEEIINIAFPIMKPSATSEEIYSKAEETAKKVMSYKPDIVFCQGEFSLCFRIVNLLKENGVRVVTVCNERIIDKETGRMIPEFRFVQFRDY